MSTVVFRLENAPAQGTWRDYAVDPARMSSCWQFRAPRVEAGLFCEQPVNEGIIYGEGPERPYQLVPFGDAPPAPTGYYVAGSAFIAGQLQWILRQTDLPVESSANKQESYSATIWDDPVALRQDVNWGNLATKANAQSSKGRSIAGYARQHWRAVGQPRPVGCTQKEVEYLFSSVELGGPPFKYETRILAEPGTYQVDGELAGAGYTSAVGSDLVQYRAHLLLRRPKNVKPNPNAGPGGIDSGSTGGGGAVAAVAGAGILYFLLR